MAEGKLDDCVGTLETGLAFVRHVGEGPFLINALVGMAIARRCSRGSMSWSPGPTPRTSTGRDRLPRP